MLKIASSIILLTCFTLSCLEVDAQLVGYSRLYTVESHIDGYTDFTMNRAGDVNGDGITDFVVGELFDNFGQSNENHASVFSGATGELIHYLGGFSYGTFFGESVRGAGDINADGYDDIIVGIGNGYINELGQTIKTRIYSGLSGEVLRDFSEPGVRGVGDLDNDGFDDIAITSVGITRFYSGLNDIPLFDIQGIHPENGLTITDLDGDNVDELIVGSLNDARVISSDSGQILFSFENYPRLGNYLGDVNFDGIDDRISGDRFGREPRGPNGEEGFETTGAVNIISGKDDSNLFTYYGNTEGDEFGSHIRTLGDINSDGVVDFVAGAPGDTSRSYVRAYVSVVVPEPNSLTLLCLATSGLLLKRRS